MKFLEKAVVLAIHDRQLAEYGGATGIRDARLLDSALAGPKNKLAYGVPDHFALAAAYAHGIARNHPFIDGNKRTAWVLARSFLALNGLPLAVDKAQAVERMVQLAEGALDETGFALWLSQQPLR